MNYTNKVSYMTSVIAICGSFGLLCVVALIGYLINKKSKQNRYQDDIKLIDYFRQWNNDLTTKKAAEDFYNLLIDICKNGFGIELKLNITKQEFDQLSLESIKTLNSQALDDLVDEIHNI